MLPAKKEQVMSNNSAIYKNLIAERGFDPAGIERFFETVTGDIEGGNEVDLVVRWALESLEEDEMEFIIRFYFMGQGYPEISEKSGRKIYKLEALHKRAIRKLSSKLKVFVNRRFGIRHRKTGHCPVCESPFHRAINEIISNREDGSTWRPVMQEIYEQFGIKIKSPQTLIGHWKYHQ
jgi:hypothetical protein